MLLALAVSNWGPQPLTPEWLPQLLRHSQPTLAYQSPQGLVLLLDSLAQLECRPHVGWMQQLEACLAPHLPTFHPKVCSGHLCHYNNFLSVSAFCHCGRIGLVKYTCTLPLCFMAALSRTEM